MIISLSSSLNFSLKYLTPALLVFLSQIIRVKKKNRMILINIVTATFRAQAIRRTKFNLKIRMLLFPNILPSHEQGSKTKFLLCYRLFLARQQRAADIKLYSCLINHHENTHTQIISMATRIKEWVNEAWMFSLCEQCLGRRQVIKLTTSKHL